MNKLGSVDSVKITAVVEDTTSKDNIWAAHGISFYLEVNTRKKISLLFDVGPSFQLLKHNLKTLNINSSKLNYLLISHEHEDHTGALFDFLKDNKKISVVSHPDTFSFKCSLETDRYKFQGVNDYQKILKQHQHLILTKTPLKIDRGIITSGEINRTTEFETWKWKNYYQKKNSKYLKDNIINEQALILNLKSKGLIIITGCTHSGIINLIKHSQKITGVNKIHAIVGGFHLKIRNLSQVKQIIGELKKINPSFIAPCHCTDSKVIKKLDDKFHLITSALGHFSAGEEITSSSLYPFRKI